MESNTLILRAALRVLSAWADRLTPDRSDVEELMRAAEPAELAMPLDELARAVIRREIPRVADEETSSVHDCCGR